VSVIAAHLARTGLDILLEHEQLEYSSPAYFIGLKPGWIFNGPFDTFPIEIARDDEVPARAKISGKRLRETVKFVEELVASMDHEASSSGWRCPKAGKSPPSPRCIGPREQVDQVASGPERFVRHQSVPNIERFPIRLAKVFVSPKKAGNRESARLDINGIPPTRTVGDRRLPRRRLKGDRGVRGAAGCNV
jgi:hypothetical protein